jgi:UDP-glucose 4-epimerase
MKILVTGGSGFIGTHLLDYLIDNTDFELIVLSRRKIKRDDSRIINIISSNIIDVCRKGRLLYGIDAVIHLAAKAHEKSMLNDENYYNVNVGLTDELAALSVDAGVKKFIYLSSLKVNGESNPCDSPISKITPTIPIGDYAISKFMGEQKLIKICTLSNLAFIIIRPPLVYGKDVGANFYKLIKLIKSSRIHAFAAFKNKRSFVAINNLNSLIHKCLIDQRANNNIFFVSDDNDISFADLVNSIANALNMKIINIYIPLIFFKFIGFITGRSYLIKKISTSFVVDITYTKITLDWSPETTLEYTLKDMLSD